MAIISCPSCGKSMSDQISACPHCKSSVTRALSSASTNSNPQNLGSSNVSAHLRIDGLDIRLDSEKIYLKTAVASEAFALRAINGIGVIDLIDRYNAELTIWKQEKRQSEVHMIVGYIFLVICFCITLYSLYLKNYGFLFTAVVFLIVAIVSFNKSTVGEKPTLMTVVRIVMHGVNRDFEFNKAHVDSVKVANFVAQIEQTLSSFHKNYRP
jgi:hypothetical protein